MTGQALPSTAARFAAVRSSGAVEQLGATLGANSAWRGATLDQARVDALLDDLVFFAPFAAYFHPVLAGCRRRRSATCG
jgi:hypothetical protein